MMDVTERSWLSAFLGQAFHRVFFMLCAGPDKQFDGSVAWFPYL